MDSQGKTSALNSPCSFHNVIRVNLKILWGPGGGGGGWREGKCHEFLSLAFKIPADVCSSHPDTLCSSYTNTTSTSLNKLLEVFPICVYVVDAIPSAWDMNQSSNPEEIPILPFKTQLKY